MKVYLTQNLVLHMMFKDFVETATVRAILQAVLTGFCHFTSPGRAELSTRSKVAAVGDFCIA